MEFHPLLQCLSASQIILSCLALPPFSYLPFGGGIRECLGKEFARLEMKLFAVRLVQNYTWELLPAQNLEMISVPVPHLQDGLKVKFGKL